MLIHRPVQEKDIPLICQFPRSAEELFFLFPKADYPLTPQQLQRAIDQRFDSTVVLWESKPAGFANFYICKPGEECHIGNVIVNPQVRGAGVGKYLIQTMIDIAFRKHAVREVHISCFHRNVAGLLLYAKMGFKPFGIEERVDKTGVRVALIKMKMCRTDG